MQESLYTATAFDEFKTMKATGYFDGSIICQFLSIEEAGRRENLYYHDGSINDLSFGICYHKPLLASAGQDQLAIIWSISKGKWSIIHKFEFDEPVSSISFSSDENMKIAIALESGIINTYSAKDYQIQTSFDISGHSPKICFIPDSSSLAIGTKEGNILILDPNGDTQSLNVLPSAVQSICANSAGRIGAVFENSSVKIIYNGNITDIKIDIPQKITLCTWDNANDSLELTSSNGIETSWHLLPSGEWKTLPVLS